MIKPRQCRGLILVLALVLSGVPIQAYAQSSESIPGGPAAPDKTPVIMGRKQATKLLIARQAPDYPPVAKVNYIQGNVQLELTIDSDGRVANAHVLQGDPVLAESALKATRKWVYQPFKTQSGPSCFITTVELKFTLNNWFFPTPIQDREHRDFLTPQQAERDFMRQVKPAQVVQTGGTVLNPEDVVHLRLLLNDQGQVDDMEASPTGKDQFDAAREALRSWTFHPAHWGTLPVAAYLDVDVPIATPPVSRTTLPPSAEATGEP
jgi:TonB family protein